MCFFVWSGVFLPLFITVVLADIDAAAAQSAAGAVAALVAADAAVSFEGSIFCQFQADALPGVAAIFAGALVLLAAAGVHVAVVAGVVFLVVGAHLLHLLLDTEGADGAHVCAELVEGEGEVAAVGTRLLLALVVGAEESLEGQDAVVEAVAVGRKSCAHLAVVLAVLLLHEAQHLLLLADVTVAEGVGNGAGAGLMPRAVVFGCHLEVFAVG